MPPVQFSPVQPAGSSCYALRLLNSDFCYHLTRPFNLNQANLLSSKAIFLKIVISTYKLCKSFYSALREMPPVQFSPVQPAGSSCYALRLLNSDFCESSRGNNLLHVGRKEPHVSKISWHHALGSTLFSNSENIEESCYVHTLAMDQNEKKSGSILTIFRTIISVTTQHCLKNIKKDKHCNTLIILYI